MKSNTEVVVGIRNVGDKNDQAQFFSGTVADSLTFIVQWLGKRSMASRIELVLARSEEEARNSLRIRERSITRIDSNDDLMVNLQKMLEQAEEVDVTHDVA